MGKKAKGEKPARRQEIAEHMVAEQQRTAEVLQSLSMAVGELQPLSGQGLLEEIRKLLDDVLVAQHRTNHLLEFALRAGFDDEEEARNT